MQHKKDNWLAAYLYYSHNQDEFIQKQVIPFVQSVMNKKLAEQYFFIRYWEKGQHIRLRFKGDETVLKTTLKTYLEEYFTNYFNSNPSDRSMLENASKGASADWYPNNSVQFAVYEPETERYGGETGILISELQFEASSNAVLAQMEEAGEWNYNRSLGAAIKMHLSFAYATGMDLDETKKFYTTVFQKWFRMAYQWTAQQENEQKMVLNSFEENFEKQGAALVPFHRTMWEALQEGEEFEEEWLNRWIADMKSIYHKLQNAVKNNELIIKDGTVIKDRKDLWHLYDSYVHMSNNRLGILNRDEAYLGYLIKRSLESIKPI